MNKNKQFWNPGDMAALARVAGMTQSNLSSTLHRRRGVSPIKAHALEVFSAQVLAKAIPWHDWLLNKTTNHAAFFGKPIRSFYSKKKRGMKTKDGRNAA